MWIGRYFGFGNPIGDGMSRLLAEVEALRREVADASIRSDRQNEHRAMAQDALGDRMQRLDLRLDEAARERSVAGDDLRERLDFLQDTMLATLTEVVQPRATPDVVADGAAPATPADDAVARDLSPRDRQSLFMLSTFLQGRVS